MGTTRFWTEDKFDFMESHTDMTLCDFVELFNTTYSVNVRGTQITQAIRQHKKDIAFNRRYKKYYTEEMIQFLRDNVEGKSNGELAELFNAKFGTDKTSRHINDVKKHYGIKNHSGFVHKGNSGSFQQGHKPWNTYRVGSVILNRDDDMLYVKVTEDDKKKSVYNQKQLARIIYQLWHDDEPEIKSEECILFLDGNKYNFAKENMVRVDRSCVVSATWKMYHNGIETELKPAITLKYEIEKKTREKKKELNNEQK